MSPGYRPTYFHEPPKVARVPKLDVKIDFLGYRAGDCLLASRDAFSGNFKGWESIREYLHLFCEFLADKCKKQDKCAIEIVKYDEIQYLFVWDALFYDGNECIKELIRTDLAVKAQKLLLSEKYALDDSGKITLDTVYETLRKKEELIIFGLEKDDKARDESISVENRKEQVKLSEGQAGQKQQGLWEDVDVEDALLEGKVYYTSRLIFEMLSEYKQFQSKTVFLIEQPVRYWYIKEWTCKKKDIGISLPAALANAYKKRETYIVVDREKNKFLDLVVEKPPLCQEQVDLKMYKESEVILLPFINSAYLMLGSRSDTKLVNKEEFIRRIQEGKQWAKAVNWTVNKHKGKAYVTRTQIEKEYTELCEMLYDIAEFEYRKKMKDVNSI